MWRPEEERRARQLDDAADALNQRLGGACTTILDRTRGGVVTCGHDAPWHSLLGTNHCEVPGCPCDRYQLSLR